MYDNNKNNKIDNKKKNSDYLFQPFRKKRTASKLQMQTLKEEELKELEEGIDIYEKKFKSEEEEFSSGPVAAEFFHPDLGNQGDESSSSSTSTEKHGVIHHHGSSISLNILLAFLVVFAAICILFFFYLKSRQHETIHLEQQISIHRSTIFELPSEIGNVNLNPLKQQTSQKSPKSPSQLSSIVISKE